MVCDQPISLRIQSRARDSIGLASYLRCRFAPYLIFNSSLTKVVKYFKMGVLFFFYYSKCYIGHFDKRYYEDRQVAPFLVRRGGGLSGLKLELPQRLTCTSFWLFARIHLRFYSGHTGEIHSRHLLDSMSMRWSYHPSEVHIYPCIGSAPASPTELAIPRTLFFGYTSVCPGSYKDHPNVFHCSW